MEPNSAADMSAALIQTENLSARPELIKDHGSSPGLVMTA